MKIYLAGPIGGCTDSEANDWRTQAKNRFGEDSCVDPMRRDYRGKTDEHYKEIVHKDLDDIDASDLVLANCWKPGWGTPMEIFYSYLRNTPVIAVAKSKASVSPWLRYHATVVYYSLDDAFRAIEDRYIV